MYVYFDSAAKVSGETYGGYPSRACATSTTSSAS